MLHPPPHPRAKISATGGGGSGMRWDRALLGGVAVRSEKLQNESFPNFSNFRPDFCPEFCSEFSRIFRGFFVLRFVGDGEQKKFTKSPCHLSMQNSQANAKKYSQNSSWRAGKVSSCDAPATHSKLQKELQWGFSHTLEPRGGGGV